jgi:hypothetical protein
MGSLKQFLVCGIVALSCITILELSYTGFVVVKNFNEFSWWNLIATLAINLIIIFFAVTSIFGATSENFGLLVTCMAFSIVELVRSLINAYDTWSDEEEKGFNKIFATFDAGNFSKVHDKFHNLIFLGILISMIVFLASLAFLNFSSEQKKTTISSIGRSLDTLDSQMQETST